MKEFAELITFLVVLLLAFILAGDPSIAEVARLALIKWMQS
jgi:hypothetical protein